MSTTTALIALASGSLGALLGGVLSFWGDHRRWRREDRQRWHDRRLNAYATTLDRLTRVFIVLGRSTDIARPRIQPPWAPLRLRRQFQGAETALREAQEALITARLVGGPQGIVATEGCLHVIGKLTDELATWSRAGPTDVVDRYLPALTAARNELITAARRELDVYEE